MVVSHDATLAGADLAIRAAAVAGTLIGFVGYAERSETLHGGTATLIGGAIVAAAFAMVWQGRRTHALTLGRVLGPWFELAIRAEVLLATALMLAAWCGPEDSQRTKVPFAVVTMVACGAAALVAQTGCDIN